MVTGNVDTSSSLDTTIPSVFIRQGSATGQTVAVGYGLAESYTGPTPGSVSASASLSAGSGCPGGWATIPYWAADTGSTVINNSLQAPFTGTATVTAAVSFSGAYGGTIPPFAPNNPNVFTTAVSIPSTQIRIYSPTTGAVVATSGIVLGNGGTCVASAAIPVTYGELFTVQMLQGGIEPAWTYEPAGHLGSISPGGSLSINPPSVGTVSPATVVPLLANQTVMSGSTTLYVMLQTSDTNNTAVYAAPTNPGLWVVPIPSGT